MIVANGYIKIIKQGEVTFDENGLPKNDTAVKGCPIPCNFMQNTYNKQGFYEGGTFTSANYIIHIDLDYGFAPCRLSLYDGAKRCLGEYSVQKKGITHLESVSVTKLVACP